MPTQTYQDVVDCRRLGDGDTATRRTIVDALELLRWHGFTDTDSAAIYVGLLKIPVIQNGKHHPAYLELRRRHLRCRAASMHRPPRCRY